MDESGRKDAEGDSPVEQQGIFSSPDLAVNSENLEEIKPELSEDNKSRIASAFAMTDATQQHEQLADQMANQDQNAVSGTVLPAGAPMNNPNSTTSSATGDIKIPGVKKKSKLPLILLALVVLAAIGGGVAWVLFSNKDDPQESLKTMYADLMEYINNSPDGEYIYDAHAAQEAQKPPQSEDFGAPASPDDQVETVGQPESADEAGDIANENSDNENDDQNVQQGTQEDKTESDRTERFIFVASEWLEENELRQYYNEVGERYQKFIDKARASENQVIKNTADSSSEIFPAVLIAMKQEIIERDIAKYIYDGDAASAKKYVDELVTTTSQHELTKNMISEFSEYLRQITDVYEIYNNEGCVFENTVDWGCAADLNNSTAESASVAAVEHLDNAMEIAANYEVLAVNQLAAFSKLLENVNE